MPLAALAWTPLLASCAHHANDRARLGTLAPSSTFVQRDDPIDEQPSERTRWEPVVVVAPIDGVRHGASPRVLHTPHHSDPPRAYGLYPTPDSSVALDADTWASELLHTGAETVGSILALFDPRFWGFAREKPWSPREVWKRTDAEGAWSTGTPARRGAGSGAP